MRSCLNNNTNHNNLDKERNGLTFLYMEYITALGKSNTILFGSICRKFHRKTYLDMKDINKSDPAVFNKKFLSVLLPSFVSSSLSYAPSF
jgi:hypothetical protein